MHGGMQPALVQLVASVPVPVSARARAPCQCQWLEYKDKSQSAQAVFQFVIVVSVGAERAQRTLPTRCVPLSSLIRRQPARLSYRGPPQPAPELCGSRRCSEGPGLSVVGGANRGETLGRRPKS